MKKHNERIQEERIIQGLTQKQMSELLGTSQQYYGQIELGRNRMTLEMAIEICRILNISMDYIVGFTDEIRRIT